MKCKTVFEKHIISELSNILKLDKGLSNKLNTLEELKLFLGTESIYSSINENGSQQHEFLNKNRYKGPLYKKYKLIASVVAMSSDFPGYTNILSLLALDIINKFRDLNPDYIIGLTQGGIPLATYISQLTGIPLIVSRVKSKTHYDMSNMIDFVEPDDELGDYFICCESKKKVILIDDEITSGNTMAAVVKALIRNNVYILGIGAAYNVNIKGMDVKGREAIKNEDIPIETCVKVTPPNFQSKGEK